MHAINITLTLHRCSVDVQHILCTLLVVVVLVGNTGLHVGVSREYWAACWCWSGILDRILFGACMSRTAWLGRGAYYIVCVRCR